VRLWDGERVCVREREGVCVCVRVSVCVLYCIRRGWVVRIWNPESVCAREREFVYMCVCVWRETMTSESIMIVSTQRVCTSPRYATIPVLLCVHAVTVTLKICWWFVGTSPKSDTVNLLIECCDGSTCVLQRPGETTERRRGHLLFLHPWSHCKNVTAPR